MLFLLFWLIIPYTLGLYSRPNSFWKSFFSLWFVLLAFVMLALWRQVTQLPQPFAGSTPEYAGYAHALLSKFVVSYWPPFLTALPWIAIGFNMFGFNSAEKITDAIGKASPKPK